MVDVFGSITVDGVEYDFSDKDMPWMFVHSKREMAIVFDEDYNLFINQVKFSELPEAEVNDRAVLARSKTTLIMKGPKKYAHFPLILNGELIPVIV